MLNLHCIKNTGAIIIMDWEYFVMASVTLNQVEEKLWIFIPQIQPLNKRFLPQETLSKSQIFLKQHIGSDLWVSKSKTFSCSLYWASFIALLIINTLSEILSKNLLLKTFNAFLICFNFLLKINIGVLVTSTSQAVALPKETEDSQLKNKNKIWKEPSFLAFSQLLLTLESDLKHQTIGNVWTSKLTFPLHIDKYLVKLFSIGLLNCRLLHVNLKLVNLRLFKSDWARRLQIILLYRPQHITTHLLIKQVDSTKIIHKNPRNWPPKPRFA